MLAEEVDPELLKKILSVDTLPDVLRNRHVLHKAVNSCSPQMIERLTLLLAVPDLATEKDPRGRFPMYYLRGTQHRKSKRTILLSCLARSAKGLTSIRKMLHDHE